MERNFFRALDLRGTGGLLNDAFDGFLLGEKLGNGIDREVYVYEPNHDQVIKVETGKGNFQNVIEMLTWGAAVEQNSPAAKYLAQVFQISVYGCWLRMERTWSPPESYKMPAKMPAFFTDFKMSNFGLTKDGRLVCHDYGTNLAIYKGVTGRMRNAEWWA